MGDKVYNVLFLCIQDAARGLMAEIYRDLDNRIRLLVNLRVEALDRLALQHELDTIGSSCIS